MIASSDDPETLRAIFRAEMAALISSPPARLAVAVSGGSDSLALTLLADDWARQRGAELIALTVDHSLRPESATEAADLQGWLRARGIDTHILVWRGPHPQSGVQQAAREARYALMAEACRKKRISHLLLGHQLEDQLETFLMRLSKGSGLDGLAAMERRREWEGLTLLRPLLGVSRDALRQYLVARGQPWIEDPSNENPRYTRTRVGAVRRELERLPGSSQDCLALALRRLQRANDGLDEYARRILTTEVRISPFGSLSVDDDILRAAPQEVALRVLAASMRAVGGGAPLRLQAIEDIYARLMPGDPPKAPRCATLGGAEVRRSSAGWQFFREAGRRGLPETEMREGETVWTWDQRFIIRDSEPAKDRGGNLRLRALGAAGGRLARAQGLLPQGAVMTARERNNLPGIWQGDALVAVPVPDAAGGRTASEKPRFRLHFRAFHWIPPSDSC
ncbi:tRNA lysidine(34) synthetase TilS [Sneathiella sp.]|uniref:tRNA lysidine(34) synthetase TilS n=1 Tax=Sneathiella sp. TaxID=1964365 RepID=UPI002FDF475C